MLSDNRSTTVEIILYYLTLNGILEYIYIYNSRNYSILLNAWQDKSGNISTTVEIILYYLTSKSFSDGTTIYNSRNYSILLNILGYHILHYIYNSRNYSILLNSKFVYLHNFLELSNFIFIILYNICTIYVK